MAGYNQGERYQQKMLCYLMLFLFIMNSMLGASVTTDEYRPSSRPDGDTPPSPP